MEKNVANVKIKIILLKYARQLMTHAGKFTTSKNKMQQKTTRAVAAAINASENTITTQTVMINVIKNGKQLKCQMVVDKQPVVFHIDSRSSVNILQRYTL